MQTKAGALQGVVLKCWCFVDAGQSGGCPGAVEEQVLVSGAPGYLKVTHLQCAHPVPVAKASVQQPSDQQCSKATSR
jgi:hypothetical protein